MNGRTPGPWLADEDTNHVRNEEGTSIATFRYAGDMVAAVHALNAHDDLAEALRRVLLNLPRSQADYPETIAARAALANWTTFAVQS